MTYYFSSLINYIKFFIITIIFLFSLQLKADQNDPILDKLFFDLKKNDNLNNHKLILNKIWEIWLEPNDAEIEKYFGLGLALMNKIRYKQSIFFFSRVIQKNPNFAEAWNKRATSYYVIGDYDNSINDINKTLILEPRHFGAMEGLGLIFINLQEYDQAIKIYKEMLKILPHDDRIKDTIIFLNDTISEKI